MKRDAVLQVRVTQEEKEWAEALAEEFGMKTSDYARMCIFVGPLPSQDEVDRAEELGESPGLGSVEDPASFQVPEGELKDDYVRYLFERITELHRDKQKRWPGVAARKQAGAEWAKVKRGEPLERIELRDGFERLKPSTYELA